MVQNAEGGKGKDERERIIGAVRSPCQENYPADAHPSAHKSVLESANPHTDSECVHLDAPGQPGFPSGCGQAMGTFSAPTPKPALTPGGRDRHTYSAIVAPSPPPPALSPEGLSRPFLQAAQLVAFRMAPPALAPNPLPRVVWVQAVSGLTPTVRVGATAMYLIFSIAPSTSTFPSPVALPSPSPGTNSSGASPSPIVEDDDDDSYVPVLSVVSLVEREGDRSWVVVARKAVPAQQPHDAFGDACVCGGVNRALGALTARRRGIGLRGISTASSFLNFG